MIYLKLVLFIFLLTLAKPLLGGEEPCEPLFATEISDFSVKVHGVKEPLYKRTSRNWGRLLGYIDSAFSRTEVVDKKKSLLDYLQPEALIGKKVLDAGCGCGAAVEELRRFGVDVIGLDILLDNNIRSLSHFIERDMRVTGLPSDNYDLVISSFSLFFYSTEVKLAEEALEELARITKPGGRVILIAVNLLIAQNIARYGVDLGFELLLSDPWLSPSILVMRKQSLKTVSESK